MSRFVKTYVVIGHAVPSDLINEKKKTNFNKNTIVFVWYSHLRSKTESVTVRKSTTGIMEDTRTVYFPLEVCRCIGVLGDNDIGMATTVFMNVTDGIVNVRNYLYGAFECAVLGSHAFGGRWTKGQ